MNKPRDEFVRFVEAVQSSKRPRAADARAVAAFVRKTLGLKKSPFRPAPRGRGQPRLEDRSFAKCGPMLAIAASVANRVGTRAPTDPDFVAVAFRVKRSKETVRRYWEVFGPLVRSQIEMQRSLERSVRNLRSMADAIGDDVLDLPLPALRPWIDQWESAPIEERERLAQEFRRILDKNNVR